MVGRIGDMGPRWVLQAPKSRSFDGKWCSADLGLTHNQAMPEVAISGGLSFQH